MINRRKLSNAIWVLVCAVGVIAVAGCKQEISGQVFIVTQGAENIKLGAIEVLLIDKAQATEFLKLKSLLVESEISTWQQALLSASNQLQIAQFAYDHFESVKPSDPQADYNRYFSNNLFVNFPDLDGIKKRASILLQQSQYLLAQGDALKRQANALEDQGSIMASISYSDKGTDISLQGYAKKEAADAEIKKLKDFVESVEKKLEGDVETAKAKLADAKAHLRAIPTTDGYLSDFFPSVIQKTMTDADGRFSFSYPKDKEFTIYASGQRNVLNGTEHYTWLVNAPKTSDAKFYLSNNNLATTDPDGYFFIKPKK